MQKPSALDDGANRGLILLRASRLEALLGPLDTLLQQTRPDNPLTPQTVIAAHPGMKQWLTAALARQVGAGRIVANLEVVLPSRWLDGLSHALLGERALALPNYRRGHLRWTLHAMLGCPTAHGVVDPQLLDYLEGAGSADERALRRFQLADRLARVLTQYLVYRGDWLQAWEADKSLFATAKLADSGLQSLESQCLAPLWRQLVGALGEHRGGLVRALIEALQRAPAAQPPLHLVGLSHLPPAELSVLQAYARRAPVFLYVPDPCREYWGGLHRGSGEGGWRTPPQQAWENFRADESVRLQDPDGLDWRPQGHPLLARWGRLGQHFFAALVEGELREDIRHGQDQAAATPNTRLQRLQESIRQLDPALLTEDVDAAAAATDGSLRIHACHTRQRELEVLRDALLAAIDEDGVDAGDMVVMAPDIQAYLPLIPALFGEPGSARERLLPYHLADVPVARSHPLFAVVQTLLGLGGSRLSAPDVVDLLAVAEVRRALNLDQGDADTLIEWLRASRVAWALDGAHKQALSLPARAEHSFAWALDRMLAGYLMADLPGATDPSPVVLPDGTELLPLAGIEGPSAAALGSLDRLLCELQCWRELGTRELPASGWAEVLRTRVDALLQVDRGDADARAALEVVQRAIANLAAEPARNGEDPSLRLPVVRELLEDALAAAPEHQRFLMGGITFCGMVPQRAIPFAMVCVLGLDEGAFPRRSVDAGIDLMTRLRRIGDRDVLSDDRYLFLETVMSARTRLHLSYLGQGVRDGKHRNPAAPLAELLAELELRAGIAADDPQRPRPWLLRHPLQPFDRRYFDHQHPALFSYSHSLAKLGGSGNQASPRLRDGAPPAAEPLPDPLPLATLQAFFKDPAKALLKDHLQLSLAALDADARLPEDEPMDAIARLHAVARRVFLQQLLPRRCADPAWQWDAQPPPWVRLGGLLPLGEDGRNAWQREAAAIEALWARAAELGRFDARGSGGGQTVAVELALPAPAATTTSAAIPQRLQGSVRNLYPLHPSEHGLQVVYAFPDSNAKNHLESAAEIGFKVLVPAFLDWAVLRLRSACEQAPAPLRLTMLAAGEPAMAVRINAWDGNYCAADADLRRRMLADLRQRLGALVALLQLARAGRSWFYPKSAWAAIARPPQPSDDLQAWFETVAGEVAKVWSVDHGDAKGERDYAPGYARLLEGDLVFGDRERDPGGAALRALIADAERVQALIMLDGGDAAATDGPPAPAQVAAA